MEHRSILVVNDDGIDAPGIRLLAQAAARLGEVYVAAPERQCSAMSQRITIFEPLTAARRDFPEEVAAAWSVNGSPADCVKLALSCLLPKKPDVLLSGVNNGFNTGFDIAYSGTVGAAMEGLMQGVPAIAVSNAYQGDDALVRLKLYPILCRLLEKPIEPNAIWNVNFPGCAAEAFCGERWERTPAPMQLYEDRFQVLERAEGRLTVHNRGVPISPRQAPEGSDVRAVLEGCLSIGKIYSMVL